MTDKVKKVGRQVQPTPGRFVQTDKSSHEAWARLGVREPKASVLLHVLVAHINQGVDPVLVASQALLGKLMGCSPRTVKRALKVLDDENWIEIVKLGPGTVSAYRINSRAAWTAGRDELKYSKFSALIIADWHDQTEFKDTELRRIPTLLDGEIQIQGGGGEEPPSQQLLDGVDSGLPVLQERSQHDAQELLEAQGQGRLID